MMLLSTYIKLSRTSKALTVNENAIAAACCRCFASAAEGQKVPRWYKEVKVVPNVDEGEFLIMLDRRPLKTPSKKLMNLPSKPLALAVAAEWQRQEWKIRPFTMPLMTIASTAIDEPKSREGVIETLLRYLHTDILTCRHEEEDIAGRQEKVTRSIYGAQQTEEAVSTVRAFLQGLNSFELAGVDSAAANCKSLLLAMALYKEGVSARDAIKIARLEDDVQLEEWGYVEGGHDIDEADTKIRVLAASVFLRLLKIVK